jgi:hypothetical protein
MKLLPIFISNPLFFQTRDPIMHLVALDCASEDICFKFGKYPVEGVKVFPILFHQLVRDPALASLVPMETAPFHAVAVD